MGSAMNLTGLRYEDRRVRVGVRVRVRAPECGIFRATFCKLWATPCHKGRIVAVAFTTISHIV